MQMLNSNKQTIHSTEPYIGGCSRSRLFFLGDLMTFIVFLNQT